jgi:hypothetical protein
VPQQAGVIDQRGRDEACPTVPMQPGLEASRHTDVVSDVDRPLFEQGTDRVSA